MSFFGALMGDFMDDDPFFGAHMRQMNSMMNMFSDPFGMVNSQMALTGPRGHHANRNGQLDMMPFGFPPMGLGMNQMFNNFENMAQNGACHSFTSSSVMTMSNGEDGRPQVYQETSSMRVGPGGIKETKKTVSDSRSGTKKMAIGHHIGERAHIIERAQNMRTGDQEENQEFINLEEEEAEEFNQEWESKARRHMAVRDRSLPHRSHRQLPELPALPSTAPSSSSSSHHPSSGRNESRRRHRHHHPKHDSQRSVEIVECTSDTEKEEPEKDESPEKPEPSRKREHSPNQETSNKRHSASKSSDD